MLAGAAPASLSSLQQDGSQLLEMLPDATWMNRTLYSNSGVDSEGEMQAEPGEEGMVTQSCVDVVLSD